MDDFGVPGYHWTRLISDEPFDLPGLLRECGVREPADENFVRAPA
jgi:hypothetical protein